MIPYWVAPQLREIADVYGRIEGEGVKDTQYRQSVIADGVEEEREG